ncbi:MAG: hypothetical protein RIA10_07980 [Amphiplicatus sp.]
MIEEEKQKRRAIADAARNAAFQNMEAWQDLALLSHNTVIEAVEVFEDEIVFEGAQFRGTLVWHVTLTYTDPDEEVTDSESFPGFFEGVMDENGPHITRMLADTSYFYE